MIVDSGPVKDVIIRGDAIDQTEFPVPKWHYLEGGRYIHTFSAIVTRDPDTGVMNVGLYRGMIGAKRIPHHSFWSKAASTGERTSSNGPRAASRCQSPA